MNATPTHPDHGDVPARPPASTGPSEPGPAPLLNIANILTIVRLVLVPVFVQLMLGQGGDVRLMATAVFIGAALTDRLDGQLARSRGLVTSFGKIADPIADKALTLSAFVLLSVAGHLWWWVTIVIIVRELGITLLRLVMLRRAVIAASRGGKLKTALQIVGIVGLLTPWDVLVPGAAAGALTVLARLVIAGALIVTMVTGVDYAVSAWRIWRQGPPEEDSR